MAVPEKVKHAVHAEKEQVSRQRHIFVFRRLFRAVHVEVYLRDSVLRRKREHRRGRVFSAICSVEPSRRAVSDTDDVQREDRSREVGVRGDYFFARYADGGFVEDARGVDSHYGRCLFLPVNDTLPSRYARSNSSCCVIRAIRSFRRTFLDSFRPRNRRFLVID